MPAIFHRRVRDPRQLRALLAATNVAFAALVALLIAHGVATSDLGRHFEAPPGLVGGDAVASSQSR